MNLSADISTLVATYATEPVYSFPRWVDKSQYLNLLRYMEWNPRASRLIKKMGIIRFDEYEMSRHNKSNIIFTDFNKEKSDYMCHSYCPKIFDTINEMQKSHVLINYDYETRSFSEIEMKRVSNSEIPNTIYVGTLAMHAAYLVIDKYEHSRTRFIKKVAKILDNDYVSKSSRSKPCLLL